MIDENQVGQAENRLSLRNQLLPEKREKVASYVMMKIFKMV